MSMNKTIKLNSYISESFINVNSDNNSCKITISLKENIQHDFDVYINSEKVSFFKNNTDIKSQSVTLSDVKNGYVRIYINPSYQYDAIFNIIIKYNENDYDTYECIYTPTLLYLNNINTSSINDIQSSYMMIRTNPKLSGNIKLVIDDNSNLYLDTFAINNELSENKYKKRPISCDSYYSNDIRNIFKTISSDSLYSIPINGDNFNSVINEQFIDIYNYGVKLNNNRSYSENFAMLAPLWINETLPDYFIIFKIENFKDNKSLSATDRLKYCIENGTLIKFFDMRRNSKLGKYLRNHQSEISNYMTSGHISNNLYNSWYGISIDAGIITNAHEPLYEIDKIDSQVNYDEYITRGYERNRLLNPYLINLEFLFNDNNSANLSINQYIGFFVYNHEFKSIYKIDNIEYDNDYNISTSQLFNKDVKLNNRIFNISIDDVNGVSKFYRFTKQSEIESILSLLNNVPYENLLRCPINNSNIIKNHPQFITININKPIQIGEHLRIIDKNDINDEMDETLHGCIYEVIASKDYNNSVSTTYSNIKNNTIKCVYGTFTGYDTFDNINEKDIIKKQIVEIVNIFNSMNNPSFKISTYSDNSISFMAIDAANKLIFERITNEIIYNIESDAIIEDSDIDKTITYFNNFIIPSSILKIEGNYDNDLIFYTPINFEVWNNRKIYIVNFTNYNNNNNDDINVNSSNVYSYSINKKYILNTLDKECLTISTNNNYIKLNNFGITYSLLNYDDDKPKLSYNTYNDAAKNIILSPYNHDEYVIQTDNEVLLNNNIINLYSVAPVHFNIAGLSPIKDFSFNVLDSNGKIKLLNTSTQYTYSFSDEEVITLECEQNKDINLDVNTLYQVSHGSFKLNDKNYYRGDFIPVGTNNIIGLDIYNSLIIYSPNDNVMEYFSIHPRVDIDYSFENLNDYIGNNRTTTSIPLITPTLCKWHINGTDVLGNKIKKICQKSHNNNIDVLYKDVDILGYSSFKYTKNNPLYIYNNINDIVNNDKTLIDKIINKELPILSIFSNDNTINNKFSTLFYNKSINSLETIYCGKKINIKFSKLNDIFKYNGYMFSIINSSHSNKSKNEIDILISDKERICILINYNNNRSGLKSYKNNNIIDNIYDSSSDAILPQNECPFSVLNSNILLSDITNKNSNYIPISNKLETTKNINLFIAAITDNNKNTYKAKSYTYYIPDISSNDINEYYINVSNKDVLKSEESSINVVDNNITKTYNDVYEYIIGDTLISTSEIDISSLNNTLHLLDNNLLYSNIVDIEIDDIINDNISYFINPDFSDIIEFENIETNDINSLLNYNLISSNTNIKNVNSIKQLWINKQFNNIEKINNDDIKIDCIFNYNPLLTDWDDVLRIYNTHDYISTKGYKSNKNNVLFFGATAPVLNDDFIELKKWNNVNIKIDNETYKTSNDKSKKYLIKIDLSDALISYIKNDTNFININWDSNIYNDVDEYIKNMLSKYYIINNKNTLKLFRCYSSNITNNNKFIDFNDSITYEQCDNISFDVVLEDNHYYLIFELPFNNYQYSIKYKIIK